MADDGDIRLHVVHTGRDGTLATTSEADMREMFDRIKRERRLVVHFHGGLVDRASGFGIAESLRPVYEAAGAYPVFFVWSSGVTEILRGNFREILGESIFKTVRAWVLRYAYGKLRQSDEARAAGALPIPRTRDLRDELAALDRGAEPYADVEPVAPVAELSPEERLSIESEVAADPALTGQIAAATGSVNGARGIGVAESPTRTLVSPDVLEELTTTEAGTRGIVSTAAVGRKVAQIVVAVIGRYRAGTDHGLYCTVVEEVLRSLYLANLGAALWQAIKQETEDTFARTGPARGGTLFLDELERLLAAGADPEITLVGHSTGAIFIENLLAELRRRNAGPTRVKNIAYLAPASVFPHSWQMLEHWPAVAENFRLFAMTDEAERRDHVAPGYPRSLLYLVSGVAERDGDRSAWVPLVGMARYYVDPRGETLSGDPFERLTGVRDVRAFVVGDGRTVWSPTPADALAGFRASARTHGGFDDDPDVRASLQQMIQSRN